MRKLDWERLNSKKRIESRGTMLAIGDIRCEMPPSSEDLLIDFDPYGDPESYLNFLHKVVQSELTGDGLPKVPVQIKKDIQPLIDHYGGLLEWAQRTRDYERVRLEIRRKQATRIDKIRRRFMHHVAEVDVIPNSKIADLKVPDELKEEVEQSGSIQEWVSSRREYRGIRENAENYAKRHSKKRNAV